MRITTPKQLKQLRHSPLREAGLTMLEIMIVLIIIGVVAATFGKKLFGAGAKAKARITRLTMTQLKSEIEAFQLEYNKLPNSLRDLVECTETTGSGCVPITNEASLQDAWGQEIKYAKQGERAYELKSYGDDGQAGGDDITLKGP